MMEESPRSSHWLLQNLNSEKHHQYPVYCSKGSFWVRMIPLGSILSQLCLGLNPQRAFTMADSPVHLPQAWTTSPMVLDTPRCIRI